jgi:kynurenine formamidase
MAPATRRRCLLEVEGDLYEVDLADAHDLAIPLCFSPGCPQPGAFWLDAASSKPVEVDGFVGSVEEGGPVNCFQVTFWPHGNGTHTETVGHITSPPPPVGERLGAALIPATLVTIPLVSLEESGESYPWRGMPEDSVVTRAALERCSLTRGFGEALILRTSPNGADKKNATYSGQNPAYLTSEAMAWVRERGVEHLLVDLPSVDREEDDGILANHRTFWGVPRGSKDPSQVEGPWRTITEMIYVPEALADGRYLLSLQIPHFVLDAAPSRPLIYAASFVRS